MIEKFNFLNLIDIEVTLLILFKPIKNHQI